MKDDEIKELRQLVRLAAIVGQSMKADDGPSIANAAERIADAVVQRVRTGRDVHPTFGKEGQMAVTVVDGQRVEAPAAAPGGAASPFSAQQLVNALAAAIAAQGAAAPAPAAPPPAGGEIGQPVSVTQTPPK